MLANWRCPRKFKGIYIEGIKGEQSPMAARGEAIHAKAESFLLGRTRGLPPELNKLARQFRNLKKLKPMTEVAMGINESWEGVSYGAGWCKAKLDALARVDDEMIFVDHKTGRVYGTHEMQAEIYAIVVACNVPEAENYHGEFFYTDQGLTREWDFDHDHVEHLIEKYEAKVGEMHSATRFPIKPSHDACKFCPIRSDKWGRCQGWKKV